jgi:hypothetical protein
MLSRIKTSNFGPDVDVFALSVHIPVASASIKSFPIRPLTLPSVISGKNRFGTARGTPFAAARVGGYLAMALTTLGDMEPDELYYALKNNAIAVVTGQPPDTYTTCVAISPSCLLV